MHCQTAPEMPRFHHHDVLGVVVHGHVPEVKPPSFRILGAPKWHSKTGFRKRDVHVRRLYRYFLEQGTMLLATFSETLYSRRSSRRSSILSLPSSSPSSPLASPSSRTNDTYQFRCSQSINRTY